MDCFGLFVAWTNNLSDYEDEGYSDIDEEESDEEFNQKTEGSNDTLISYKMVTFAPRNEMLLKKMYKLTISHLRFFLVFFF